MSGQPLEGRQVLVIVNPVAHNLPSAKQLRAAGEWLQANGWDTEWAETERPGDGIVLAARAAERGVPFVFACGGDGTVNEAVNGLAGSDSVLGVIPAGVTNLWARDAGIPRRSLDAVRLIAEGERRRVDLGRAGSRRFLMLASYGIDGVVVRETSRRIKSRFGAAAYVLSAFRQALTYRGTPVELTMNGERMRLHVLMVFIGNTRLYAGITKITPQAIADDGLLDVAVYEGRSRIDIITHAFRTLRQTHFKSKKVLYRRVERLRIESIRPLPLQVDGDAVPESPSDVVVEPGALWVAVPRGVTSPIFSARPGLAREESPTRP